MTNQYDFTNDEWATIASAPGLIGAAVAKAAKSGIVGEFKETRTIVRSISSEVDDNPAKTLINAIGELDYKEQLEALTHGKPKSPAALAEAAATVCSKVDVILKNKATPDETAGFKAWLIEIAESVAGTAKEGGVRVSPPETALIARLTGALDCQPQS